MSRISGILLVLLFASFVAAAQDTSVQEGKKAALEREIAQLQQQIAENVSKSSSALNDLTLVRKQVEVRKAMLAESEKELAQVEDSVRITRQKINVLQARIDTLSIYYERLVRGAYKNRDAKMWYVHILSSNSLAQATRRFAYLRGLSERMNEEAIEVKNLRSELETEAGRLEGLSAEAKKLRDSRAADLKKLQSEEKRVNDLVSQLGKYRTRYQNQLKTKQKQVEALNREIEKIIAQYMEETRRQEEASKSSGKAQPAVTDYKLAAEFEANKGRLPWPADGPVLEKFGRHSHPVYTSIVMPFNNGISIGLAKGSVVKAVFDGEVKSVIVMPGYNKCVLVQHGNYFSFYCKLGQVSVKAGDKVSTGSVIGTVDTIDGQTMLHFQIWKEKNPQNPEIWLRQK